MTTAIKIQPTVPARTVAELIERLGGISPQRVLLQPPPGTASERDLLAAQKSDRLCELVDGTLVEKPMGYRESLLAVFIARVLDLFVRARNLGLVSGADGMMKLVPGLVRIPDVAFVSWTKIPGRKVPAEAVPNLAPDLAVEILSSTNTPEEMARKRREYFASGTTLVWEVDIAARCVSVFSAPDRSTRLDDGQTLTGGSVLPGFELRLADLFEELERKADA